MLFLRPLIIIIFVFLLQEAHGQEYKPPETRSSKLLIKDFLRMHLEYPEQALSDGEEGVVTLSFIVDKDGKTSDIKVTGPVSPSVDSAAVRLFRLILWKPATSFGEPVSSEYEFNIKYNIKRYKSCVKKRGYAHIPLPYEPVSSSLKIYALKELDKLPQAIIDPGYSSVQEFITDKLEMPEAAIKLNLTGTVILRFVLERNGLPSNIIVVEPLGGGCTEEAIRVIQMIRWLPGIKDNEAVRTCYDIKLNFRPPGELKSKQIPNQGNSGL
ncbi:MAG: hypothetical protein DRJ02_07480 [Bacteroidetes bacterium]|nr:MAG: hypothetical protein DRJ02_07480 [Bacteroidota bacterium]